jgi:hypothetical protein
LTFPKQTDSSGVSAVDSSDLNDIDVSDIYDPADFDDDKNDPDHPDMSGSINHRRRAGIKRCYDSKFFYR